MRNCWIGLVLLSGLWTACSALAQGPASTRPTVGLRELAPDAVALEHVDVVVAPGRTIEDATVLIRGDRIAAVGHEVSLPEGVHRIDHRGRTVYAGLIDAFSEVDVPEPSSTAGAPYWNGHVTPQRSAAQVADTEAIDGEKLRSQGITMCLLAPRGGIIKGSSCLMLTGEGESGQLLMRDSVWQHLSLTVPRRGGRDAYPNSPMGAVALLRQSLWDARWYTEAHAAHQANPSLPRPEADTALEALADAIAGTVFVIDAPNERMAQRAESIASEFRLRILLRGSGREYRELAEIAAGGRPILLPVDFPDPPKIDSASDAREALLVDLLDWRLAPSNPARLARAGVPFCLTTDGLASPDKFLQQVRRAVKAGLAPEEALAAMTTRPAELLGASEWAGTVEPRRIANLVITDGDLFDDDTKTLETWVAGKRYVIDEPKDELAHAIAGSWRIDVPGEQVRFASPLRLQLSHKDSDWTGTLEKFTDADAAAEAAKLKQLVSERHRLSAAIDLSKIDETLPAGTSWLTLVAVEDSADPMAIEGTLRLPSGETLPLEIAELEAEEQTSSEPEGESGEGDEDETPADEAVDDEEEDSNDTENDEHHKASSLATAVDLEVVRPLGAYGFAEPPRERPLVMFRGATVWTCGPQGTLERADVLIRDGRIEEIAEELQVPDGCEVIDVTGKHLTPGLIDCHSHMATDGGVNESGQAITAEVRIGDFIDNSDISIYRQLAGGLTTSHILHGSANPIGGQSQVIKLRWGASMDDMRFEDAPGGIKFALGENVKRSRGRYPDTRMGVEQIIRDQFRAAKEYREAHQRYRSGDHDMLPPRVDLQLEAIAEVLQGDRWVHCHSYRQDEIVATLEVLEAFGVRIGSLQHILEGYKVADRMQQHGAMASSFSDWWAYKFEVYDAIPYNGALMHEQGIVVSFNSDDAELARHLNTEAGKAVKYGGVSPEESLRFVTLNPAKQLRIEDRVGSIEAGKDADLVVWSRSPLSTMTRCEQTWIDGRCYFSLDQDAQLRSRDAELHARLVQEIVDSGDDGESAREPREEEEARWHRHDIYCGHGGHDHAAVDAEQHHTEEALQ